MKFTPEQRKLIKETRNKIKNMQVEQNKLFSNLLEELNMDQNAEDWLFDYIYNSFGTIKKLESLLK